MENRGLNADLARQQGVVDKIASAYVCKITELSEVF